MNAEFVSWLDDTIASDKKELAQIPHYTAAAPIVFCHMTTLQEVLSKYKNCTSLVGTFVKDAPINVGDKVYFLDFSIMGNIMVDSGTVQELYPFKSEQFNSDLSMAKVEVHPGIPVLEMQANRLYKNVCDLVQNTQLYINKFSEKYLPTQKDVNNGL